MENLYRAAVDQLENGRKVVLATIVRLAGSAPRPVGTKCLVLEDGSIVGTIGGGLLEYQVADRAKELFAGGYNRILNFQMTGREIADSQMICGGKSDIYLQLLSPADSATLAVFARIISLAAQGRRGTLFTRIADGRSAGKGPGLLLVTGKSETIGGLGINSEAEQVICREYAEVKKPAMVEVSGDRRQIFAEPVRPDDVLYLFGAGHISIFVASFAKTVGFKVVVIDDRHDFANDRRFANVDELLVMPFAEALDRIEYRSSSYIVIVTRGHIHDRNVLRGVIDKKAAYIGMIGSRRKKQLIYQSLVEDGVDAALLERVHSPIGMEIDADTPEEIAISIVGELIAVRASK